MKQSTYEIATKNNRLFLFRAIGEDEIDDDIMMGDVPAEEEGVEPEEEAPPSMSAQKILEERTNTMVAHLLFSIVWSVGGTLDGASRLKFDEFFRSLCEMDTSGKYPR